MSISSKIQSLITAANSVTGESRTDLTSAVQDLKDGYGGGGLPAEYEAVEYIQTNGNQYIDTGVVMSKVFSTRCCFDYVQAPSSSSAFSHLFGINVTGVAKNYLVATYNNSQCHYFQVWGSGYYYSTVTIGNKHTITFGGGNTAIDDDNYANLMGVTSGVGDMNQFQNDAQLSLYLFAVNDSGTPSYGEGSYLKLYSCQIFNNHTGETYRDFVPCKRKADDEAGLYDLVNGVFYTNAGTGDFVVPTT